MSLNVAVLIPAAGAGSRFKSKEKKQFSELDGRAVFLRSIEPFADRDDVRQILIAIPPDEEELFQIRWEAKLGFYGVRAIVGGVSRYETVTRMLQEIDSSDLDLIAIHDAVRPCVTKEKIDDVFEAAAKSGAAILATPLVGTIKKVDPETNLIQETISREGLWEAQTPQVFKPDILRKIHEYGKECEDDITDDSLLAEKLGIPVTVVPGDPGNIKITTRTDLAIASAILKARPKPKAKGPTGPWAAEQGW